MITYGITLLSGGLDSTTVTAYARSQTNYLTALTFYYGQTHSKEVDCARRISRSLGVEQKMVDISFLREAAWYSALTNPDQFPLPTDTSIHQIGSSIPITYVPLRNTIFLSLAAAFLESQVLYAIEVEGVASEQVAAQIFLAPNAIDYSGYPDCRPEFFDKMRESLGYGSKLWTQYQVPINVNTPIIHLSKAEIIRMAAELRAPLELTWSCYEGGAIPCGVCESCILRAKGFEDAGRLDPGLVQTHLTE